MTKKRKLIINIISFLVFVYKFDHMIKQKKEKIYDIFKWCSSRRALFYFNERAQFYLMEKAISYFSDKKVIFVQDTHSLILNEQSGKVLIKFQTVGILQPLYFKLNAVDENFLKCLLNCSKLPKTCVKWNDFLKLLLYSKVPDSFKKRNFAL